MEFRTYQSTAEMFRDTCPRWLVELWERTDFDKARDETKRLMSGLNRKQWERRKKRIREAM